MGDGAAKGAIFGAFLIHMDPLMVARSLGKLIDPLLGDGDPLTDCHLLPDQSREFRQGLKGFHDMTVAGACRSSVKPIADRLPLGQVVGHPLWCEVEQGQTTRGKVNIVLRIPQMAEYRYAQSRHEVL